MIKHFDDSEILRLYASGLSSYQVHEVLNPSITVRQVQRIIQKAGISRPRIKPTKGRLDLDGDFIHLQRPLFDSLMEKLGHDPYKCGLCGKPQKRKCDIHHKRYEGATLYDLVYACRRCNLRHENMGLA